MSGNIPRDRSLLAELHAARQLQAPKAAAVPKNRQRRFLGEAVAAPAFIGLPPCFVHAAALGPDVVSVSTTVNLRVPSGFADRAPWPPPLRDVKRKKRARTKTTKAPKTTETGKAGKKRRHRTTDIAELLTCKRAKTSKAVQRVPKTEAAIQDAAAALQALQPLLRKTLLLPLQLEPKASTAMSAAARRALAYPIYDKTFRRPLKATTQSANPEPEAAAPPTKAEAPPLDQYLRLPRAYGLAAFAGHAAVDGWWAKAWAATVPAERLARYTATLRPHQVPAMAHVTRQLETLPGHSGILDGDCGCGKTCMGLYTTSYFKRPTLIFVHNSDLMEQWLERIPRFLPDAKVGVLQGPTRPPPDADICVAMIHTVARLSRTEARAFRRYGLLLVDEVHHICARTFSKGIRMVSPPIVLGLTATPERNDGLDAPLEYLIGPVLYHIRSEDEEMDVQFVRYKDRKFRHATRWKQMDYVGTITKIVTDPFRTESIAQLVLEITGRPGENRHVLVLGERVCLLEALHALLPGSGLLRAGKKHKAANVEAKKQQIVLGSFRMAQEGLDIPQLDTLVIASPLKVTKTFKQPLGRIQRGGSPNRPLLIDFYDDYRMFKGMMYGRRRYYEGKDYQLLPEQQIFRPYPGDDGQDDGDDDDDDAFWRGRATQRALDEEEACAGDDALGDFFEAAGAVMEKSS
jgi:superfamily II DNA or RNA helicase